VAPAGRLCLPVGSLSRVDYSYLSLPPRPMLLCWFLRNGAVVTADVPLRLVDGHNLLFRACFGTPAQILSRDETGKRDLTTQFMFFALLRKGINDEFSGWPEVMVVFDGQDGAGHRKDTDPATRPPARSALRPCGRSSPCPMSNPAWTGTASPGSRSGTTPKPTT
jgi:hypothetical protein